MDSVSLAVFVEAVSAGSLAGAARRLGLSSLAAGRSLASLEKRLGVRLLQRNTRSLSPTAAGIAFLPHAQAMLEAEAAALASVAGNADASGLLRVTASAAFGRKVVVPFIASFMDQYPKIKVDLLVTDRLVDLVGEGYDLAIRIAQLRSSDLIARRLFDSRRVLVAAPSYLKRAGSPQELRDLVDHECLALAGQNHWSFSQGGRQVSQHVSGRFTANSIEILHRACTEGLGIALLSEWDVHSEITDGSLVNLTLKDTFAETLSISAVYPSRRLVPAKVKLFVEQMRARLDKAPWPLN